MKEGRMVGEASEGSVLPEDLVPTGWLAEHLDDPSLRVVDIRGYVRTTELGGGRQEAAYVGAGDEFETGHIPGAVFVDWTTDIVDPDQAVKAQIASPERFAAALGERGIGNESDVVIVDHSGGHFATRLWWALRYYGHDRAAVLDGGYAKWVGEGRPVNDEVAAVQPAVFRPRLRPELRVVAAEVLARSTAGPGLIVDARDTAQYRGETVRGRRGGHVPGAVNLPAKRLVNEDGTWKPLEEQRRTLADVGIEAGTPVVAYCNGGVTATGVLFALHRLGYDGFANYDGSWNEWGEREELPVVEGDRPR